MTNECILDGVSEKTKMIIGIEKFDNTKKVIEKDNTMADYVTFKNLVILISCVVKHGDELTFLEETLAA